MKYYLEEVESVYSELGSSSNGLSEAEAAERLAKNGKNKLAEAKKTSLLKRFISQLADPMIIMLIAAAAVSAFTSRYSGEGFADVIIIMFVVIVNAVLGVIQESKAEAAIEALKEMTAATSKVERNGQIVVVKSEDLVVGDVVVLEAGDAVPADGRVIECASLKIEEAALTGESVPVTKAIDMLYLGKSDKDVLLGDRKNMVYMGSTVAYGRGKAIITACGMDTEMGKIATALSQALDSDTPLQIKLAELGKSLTKLVLGICVVVFAVTLWRNGNFSTEGILSVFMTAIALAVAAIPEGLPAVVTIVLSMGVTKMSQRSAVIRKLTAVETLGCTQIICSDKTGTMTQNKMTVVEHYGDDALLLARAMALCSDAEIKPGEDAAVGEPTEAALVNYAASLNLYKYDLQSEEPRIGEAPFDSQRKLMSTVHRNAAGRIIQYTKGAPDVLIDRCTHVWQYGKVVPINEDLRSLILIANKEMADKALRVLAAAYCYYDEAPNSYEADDLEKNLTFIGLTGMIDPSREEVKPAIEECRRAGIRPIMITGDHRDTAVAIAKELGIISDGSQAITGKELEEMDDEALREQIENYSVYARVQPEHKVRIVKAWQERGMVTAMTGDGVNDAPSIKTADIGVGMGITGTDVTKNVADMVLADDNFATIVGAVEEGRKIYDNIRKVIQFLLSANAAEVIGVFTASMMGFTLFAPAHLLWINMVTDCAPALALGMEKAESDVMLRAPRKSDESIFAGGMAFDTCYQGIVIALVVLASYFVGHYIEFGEFVIENSADGTTMAFLTMSMMEIFHSINLRSQHGSIFKMGSHNVYLFLAMLFSLVATYVVIYVPFLANMFKFTPISPLEYAIAMAMAASIIPIVEIVKFFQRKRRKI